MAEEEVKPTSITPVVGKPPLAVEMFPDDETVTMVFPQPVNVMLPNYKQVRFEAGPQEVPVRLADNWYLKANRVVPYAPVLPPPKPSPTPKPAVEDDGEEETAKSAPVRNLRRK
jgi:hypothetical protein